MTRYAVPPMKIPAIEIADSADLFPVHRIYCVGCNYAEHAKEMGSDPDREPPFFFMTFKYLNFRDPLSNFNCVDLIFQFLFSRINFFLSCTLYNLFISF